MRPIHVLLSFVILGTLAAGTVRTQGPPQQPEFRPVAPTPIIGILRDSNTRVGPPFGPQALHAEATATFIVNYTGFTPQAQAAFQAAVDVWANLLVSPVPIVVNAQFAALGSGLLGSAAATYIVRDFAGAPQSATWYPIAIANARAGTDLIPTEADIGASFSSDVPNWYFGTDGNTPAGQFDFMTVVLHELGHGLGFFGSAVVAGGLGYWGSGDPGAILPYSYDRAVVNAASQSIIDTTLFSNPSAALAAQFTSGALFWSGPAATAANGGVRPRLYAPAMWAQGSSYSHLNEATYPAGNVNSLMTPFIGTAESIHSPGPITLGVLTDVGWAATAQPTCSFIVTPTSTGAPAAGVVGATVTVTTAPACAWVAASSNSAFLTITSGHSGIGSGVVTYNVAPNGASFRTGTLTVAGQQVSIGQSGTGPTMGPDKLSLFFGAVSTGSSFSAQTSAQIVRLLQGPGAPVTWTATSNQPWLRVTPTSGAGSASLTVSVVATPGVPAVGTSLGFIDYTHVGAGNPPLRTAVTLTTMSAATSGPVGFVDTPADGRTGVTGAVPFTGWAVDDVEVASVAICRQAVAGEAAGANPVCGGTAEVFLGWVTFIDGARPDVAALYPQYPFGTRAGWGFMLLTNMLPNGGTGTYGFSAWAHDREGHSTLLGTRTMTCNNAQATLPFGAIDTPAQGGLVSGSAFVNFGWVLTPQPKTIPADGSTITVLVDGVAVGNASYGHFRPDIAGLFSGRNNSNGAVGFRILDTTGLTDGLHTISWTVSDDWGATEGIGSRFFTVANGTAPVSSAVADEAMAALTLDRTPLFVRRGWDLGAPMRALEAGVSGRTVIRSEEVNRVELRLGTGLEATSLGGAAVRYAGYLRTGESLAPLPIGAHVDDATGVFTWAPGVGFVGAYDFVFVRHAGARAVARRELRIVLQAKGSGSVGPQVVVETPVSQEDVAQPFALKGWAADLDSAVGTGISALHVWAYPLAGGSPVFLGSASYGSARPDVVASHGDQFGDSGFSLLVQGLPHGNYDLAVFAWSEAASDFLPARLLRVTVR